MLRNFLRIMNFRRLLLSSILLFGMLGLSAHNPVKPATNTSKFQVVDAVSGDPITGARVSIQGTAISVLTDSEGYFMIPIAEHQNELLTISFVSFQTITVPASHLSDNVSIPMIEK
ncbi:MAG: carboxypeptidase-like regulatory domain-containing protein [Flavobacteriales bacterium]